MGWSIGLWPKGVAEVIDFFVNHVTNVVYISCVVYHLSVHPAGFSVSSFCPAAVLCVCYNSRACPDRGPQAAFVLATMVRDYRAGQQVALQGSLIPYCVEQMDDPSPLLR